MKIIFIHGMNQQNYDEQSLTQHWLKSFQTGLTNAHSSIDVSSLHIKLPFTAICLPNINSITV